MKLIFYFALWILKSKANFKWKKFNSKHKDDIERNRKLWENYANELNERRNRELENKIKQLKEELEKQTETEKPQEVLSGNMKGCDSD